MAVFLKEEDFPTPTEPLPIEMINSDAARYMASQILLQEAGRGIVGVPRPSDRKWGAKHDYNLKTYGEIYKKVEIVYRGINVTAQHVMAPGYRILGGDGGNLEKIREWSEYIGLHHTLHNVVRHLMIWGNCFIEPVVDKKKRTDWNVLELKLLNPDTMYVYAKEVGDIIGYIQHPKSRRWRNQLGRLPEKLRSTGRTYRSWKKEVKNTDPNAVVFDAKDIVHLKWNPMPNSYYGVSPIEAMKRTLTTYVGMLQDLSVMIRSYGTPMIVWKMGSPERPASEKFMREFRKAMTDRNIGDDPIIPGIVEWEVVSAGEKAMQIEPYIRALRDDMFAGIAVPEVLLGGTSSGGFAASEIQLEGFSRRMIELQQFLSDMCRKQLFPRELDIGVAPFSRPEWSSIPTLLFNPPETTEQKYLRISTIINSNLGTIEEGREMLGLDPDIPEGERMIDLQKELKELEGQIAATRANATGPAKTTDRAKDKTSSQKAKKSPAPQQGR